MNHQQPISNGMFNLILPSEEDCALAPDENLGPNSAGLKSSRTGTSLWRSRLLLRLRVQRSNAVLAIQKSVLVSENELVLSEMGENLSL